MASLSRAFLSGGMVGGFRRASGRGCSANDRSVVWHNCWHLIHSSSSSSFIVIPYIIITLIIAMSIMQILCLTPSMDINILMRMKSPRSETHQFF